jgi:hypothetical protein
VAGRIRYRTCLVDSAWCARYAKKLLNSYQWLQVAELAYDSFMMRMRTRA